MADSVPAKYSAPVSSGLVVTTAHQGSLPALLPFVAARFLPAPRVHEAR